MSQLLRWPENLEFQLCAHSFQKEIPGPDLLQEWAGWISLQPKGSNPCWSATHLGKFLLQYPIICIPIPFFLQNRWMG